MLAAVHDGIRPIGYVAPAAVPADSGPVRRDDEDDRSGEAGRADGDASWVDSVVIPDDISALEAEVRALRRERRAQQRRTRLRRLTRSGRTAPLMMVVVLLIAGVAGLLVLFQPRRTPGTVDTGLAATDRRLPDVLVRRADGTTRRAREFRPAVLALAPVGCGCDRELLGAGTAARRHGVDFLLVDRTLPPLPPGLTEPGTIRLIDPEGAIAIAFGAEADGRRAPGGPVLVVVGEGGEVVRVLPEASPQALERELTGIAPLPSPTG